MDLALNNLQRLICHKTKQTKLYLLEENQKIMFYYHPFTNPDKKKNMILFDTIERIS